MSLSRKRHRLLILSFALVLSALIPCVHTSAQATANAAPDDALTSSSNDTGPAGLVPAVRGFNAFLTSSSQHDSSNGWSNVLSPGVAYRFNRIFSISAGVPIYAYINVDQVKGPKANPVYLQTTKHGVIGDMSLSGQLNTHGIVDYSANVAIGLPTGNSAYGLGAGQSTYDINNHFEKSFGIFSPDIELGIGNSSSLIGKRVHRSYTAVGTLAHFQAGSSIELPLNMSFEADVYEELPLTASTIYSTSGKGKKKVRTATGTTSSEDNGFDTALDIPLNGHITLSGLYNRSLRSHDDVAGFSLTFLLKAPPRENALPQ